MARTAATLCASFGVTSSRMAQPPDTRTSAELRAQAAQYRFLADTSAGAGVKEFLYGLADRLDALAAEKDRQDGSTPES